MICVDNDKDFSGSQMSGCLALTLRNSEPEMGAWENNVATLTRKHCELDSKLRTKVNYEKFYIKNFFLVCAAKKQRVSPGSAWSGPGRCCRDWRRHLEA